MDQGCDQVVWLDAADHRWVEEMGGMNLFFVRGGDTGNPWIATPPLTGTLLPGITRDSLLKLAPQLGVKAVEEPITTDQWQAECAAGELTEVFACGTAAVITPVGRVKGADRAWPVGGRRPRARSPCACARSSSASSTAPAPTRSAGSTRSAANGAAWP